mmetsp:Transcript_13504/g.23707  ORF Transcript_13504/g.23707 Transcript_13504/m.23707 type:complete len:143 (+) Transcript_13504:76-504(+)
MPLHCPSAPLHRQRRHAPHCAAILAGRSLAVQEQCRHAGASQAAAHVLPARRVERIGGPARCCRSFSVRTQPLFPGLSEEIYAAHAQEASALCCMVDIIVIASPSQTVVAPAWLPAWMLSCRTRRKYIQQCKRPKKAPGWKG